MERKIDDYPDLKDFSSDQDTIPRKLLVPGQTRSVRVMLQHTGMSNTKRSDLPDSTDLREWCSPVEDQGNIGSCTAHAGVAIMEYFERRAFGNHLDASRLFLCKTTRTYRATQGRCIHSLCDGHPGAFWCAPEEYWPYNTADLDKEPPGFCYALARNYQAISYYRLDTPGTAKDALLAAIKKSLTAGIPAMFGFTVYSSYKQSAKTGKIPLPTPGEKTISGHAIVAVGYDDSITIRNTDAGAGETRHKTEDAATAREYRRGRGRNEGYPAHQKFMGYRMGGWTATGGRPMNTYCKDWPSTGGRS
ncbi:MAG: C1 family peptidase [Syntrophorhabdaceae bacterium]|nr:C1 family peptidase [Syntrophorhabdaceae bacterium]HOC45360.1 C1 family peptidase [Syntrophorhabdaceae bacterium]